MNSPEHDLEALLHPDKLEDWHVRVVHDLMKLSISDLELAGQWYRYYWGSPNKYAREQLQRFNDGFAKARLRGKK